MSLLSYMLMFVLAHACVHAARDRRSIVQLASMLECTAGRSLDYVGYGCFCGAGDQGGHTAVDGVDECCMRHDQCYDDVTHRHCGDSLWTLYNEPHVVRYKYREHCTEKSVECLDAPGSCRRHACECDRQLALCLAHAQYNTQHSSAHMDYTLCRDQ